MIRVTRHMARGIEMEHPAVFPIKLSEHIIQSWEGNVYDPFLGSGTTLIAAEQLGRVCFGMEIDPGYVGVILQRAADMGLTPTLLETTEPQATPCAK